MLCAMWATVKSGRRKCHHGTTLVCTPGSPWRSLLLPVLNPCQSMSLSRVTCLHEVLQLRIIGKGEEYTLYTPDHLVRHSYHECVLAPTSTEYTRKLFYIWHLLRLFGASSLSHPEIQDVVSVDRTRIRSAPARADKHCSCAKVQLVSSNWGHYK